MADAVKKKKRKRKKKIRIAPWRETKRAILVLLVLTIVSAVIPVWRAVQVQGRAAESPKNAAVTPVPSTESAVSVTPGPSAADTGTESVPPVTDSPAAQAEITQTPAAPVQYTEPVPLTVLPSAEENPAAWYEYGAGPQDADSITILGCGDNLMHSQLYENA